MSVPVALIVSLVFADPASDGAAASDPQPTDAPAMAVPAMAVPRVLVFVPSTLDEGSMAHDRVANAITAHTRALEGQVEIVHTDVPAPRAADALIDAEPHFLDLDVKGVIWVGRPSDATAPGIELLLVAADDARVFGIDVPVVEGSEAVALESLGNVVSSASQALVGGISIAGMSEATVLVSTPETEPFEEREAPAPVASPPSLARTQSSPSREAWNRLTVGAGYAGNSFAPELRWQHGVALRIGWKPTPATWVAAGYDVVSVAEVRDPTTRLRVVRHPVTLRAGYAWTFGKRWSIPLGGRVVIDPTTQRTSSLDDSFDAGGDSTNVQVGLGGVTGLMVETSRWLRVRLDLGADVMVGRNSYVVLSPSSPAGRTFLRPDPVRFVVGLSLDFTGVRR